MFSSLKYSIGLVLPTVVLLQAPNVSAEYLAKRELFGGEDYYLDLHFSQRPNRREQGVPFTGFFAGKNKEERIAGIVQFRNQGWHYDFVTEKGKFSGVLLREKNRCEPFLSYQFTTPAGVEKGVLRAGFCS